MAFILLATCELLIQEDSLPRPAKHLYSSCRIYEGISESRQHRSAACDSESLGNTHRAMVVLLLQLLWPAAIGAVGRGAVHRRGHAVSPGVGYGRRHRGLLHRGCVKTQLLAPRSVTAGAQRRRRRHLQRQAHTVSAIPDIHEAAASIRCLSARAPCRISQIPMANDKCCVGHCNSCTVKRHFRHMVNVD